MAESILMTILFYSTAYVTLFVSIFWFTAFFTSEKKTPHKRSLLPLSIIVPVYNGERFIRRCIDSLVEQNYSRLHIIIVDNGSTDNTGKIAKGIAKNRSNVRYIRKETPGKAAALNTGLRHVTTELFGFIDADTYLSKNALKNMVHYIQGNTAAVIATIKPDNPRTFIEKIQKVEYLISSFTRKLMTFLGSLYYTPGFAIYKTNVVRKIGGFDEENLSEDLEIGLRLKNHGYNIEHSISDSAYTDVPKSFSDLFNQRMRWYRGYIHNTRKYSHMFFNKKFGDLGILVLPVQYVMLALIMPFLLYAIFDAGLNIFRGLMDVFIVEFDFAYLLSTSSLSFLTPTTFFFIVVLLAFFYMIKLSKNNIAENITRLDYVIYIIVYPFINLILWVSAFAQEFLGSKRKW